MKTREGRASGSAGSDWSLTIATIGQEAHYTGDCQRANLNALGFRRGPAALSELSAACNRFPQQRPGNRQTRRHRTGR
ncbi:hypothetical protein PLANPX_2813 [Lacipirellula parvula]|uniref:Uncharacterized protein n=1 Tax=Lacipirellula parvula TaxID=2650471 RepID=A0A5K7XEA5_9BACT|nr:hypothetical protein PLANPX_2813 [Lacipirellula parvula]